MYYLGYDIGGTKCAVSIADVDADRVGITDKVKFPTQGTAYEVLDRMAAEALALIEKNGLKPKDIVRAGISCGGPLDSARGVILSPPNLPGWDEIPATEYLAGRTGIETRLQNDANACAVAEWKFGAGRGAKNMVFLTFGTGLGAGLILDGKLYSGASDMAGEVGHVRLAPEGPLGYGKHGSVEGFCSGGGLANTGRMEIEAALGRGEDPLLWLRAGKDPANVTAKLIALLADEGDEMCRGIYSRCGERLGMLLAFLADIINPEIVVIGSIFLRCEHLLRPSMERVLEREALPHAAKAMKVVPAGLGESIGDYAAVSVACM